MAGRSVDVSLVIKAIDQSKSALDTVAQSLAGIAVAQKAVASGSSDTGKALDGLFKNIDELDKVLRNLSGGGDKLAGVYSRQTEALSKATAQIDTYKAKLSELKAIQASYQTQLKNNFVGPLLPDVTKSNLRSVTSKINRIEYSSLPNAEAAQARALEAVRQTRDAQRQIAETQNQVSAAIRTSVAEYDRLSAAAERAAAASARQAAEANRNAQVVPRINAATGVSRPAATDNGATFSALEAKLSAEIKAEADALKQLETYAQGVAESLDPAVRTMRLLVEEQSRLTAAVNAGKLTQDQANAAIAKYKTQLSGQAAAAEKASRETEQLATYVQELRRSYDPAAYAAKFFENEQKRLNAAVRAGVLDQQEYAKALDVVKKRRDQLGEKNQVRLFGLEPFQTQNLMFQFNDIATQLASGTSLTQTLAQQGGQIIQLFPRVGNAIAGAFTVGTAGAVALIAAFGLVVARAFDIEDRIRSLNATLIANADGASYNAEKVIASAKAMREFGVAIDDAMKIANVAINAGLDESKFTRFGEASKGLALRLGTDVPSAAQRLADALTGGYDALVALDKQTNIFTASELRNIRSLIENGKVIEANEMAAKILDQRLSDVARKSEGPWAKATNDLAVSWNNLLDRLANSGPVSGTVDILTSLISKTSELVDWIGKVNQEGGQGSAWWTALFGASPTLGVAVAPWMRTGSSGSPQTVAGGKGDRASIDYASQTAAELADANRRQKQNDEIAAAKDRLAVEVKITKESELQAAVAAKRRVLELEAQKQFPLGDPKIRTDYVEAQLRIYREGLERQLADFNKGAQSALEQRMRAEESALKGYVARVVRTESAGNPNARNPNSSATGLGQFIDSTWLATFKKEFPAQAKQLSDAAILSLRTNVEVSKALIEAYARDNAAILKKAGVGITEANLYLAHFLGPDGAVKVLKANPNASIADVLGGTRGGRAAIAANPTILGGNATAGSVIGFAQRRFPGENAGSSVQARLEGENAIQEAINRRDAAQREFNSDLDDEIAKRSLIAQNEKELLGLSGKALLDKQKEQAIAEAILAARTKLRDKLNDPNADLSQAQIDAITQSVGAKFDAQTTSVVAGELQNKVSELLALRDQIQAQIRSELERGNANTARELEGQLTTVNGRLLDASKELYDYQVRNADALGLSAEQLDTLKLKQDALTESTRQWTSILGIDGQRIANTFTTTMVNAIDQFAQAVASGKDAFSSLWDAFRSFAANFLIQIAQMIQQQIIFNLVSGLLSGFAGSIAGPASSSFSSASVGLRAHSGGVVGMASTYGRNTGMVPVNPAWFANANRYHTGGIAGLKPGEVPSILQAGEEVLTRSDPRHVMNGGGAGGGVKIVNTFDHADFFSKGADTRAGEKAILNMVRSNPRAFKQAMSGG